MAAFDREGVFGAKPPKPPTHEIGQGLDDLSAPELAERIESLETGNRQARERDRGARSDSLRRERVLQELDGALAGACRILAQTARRLADEGSDRRISSARRGGVKVRLTIINYEWVRPNLRVLNGSYSF